jgi:hypothetical protein
MPSNEFGISDNKDIYWAIHRHLDGNYSTRSWAQAVNYEALKAIVFLHKPTVHNESCGYCLEIYPCKTIHLIWIKVQLNA